MMSVILAVLGLQALIGATTFALRVSFKTETPPTCPYGDALPGVSCGRGPSRQDCPDDYVCVVDPSDLSAVCCPLPPPKCPHGDELPGVWCGRGPNHQDCAQGYHCLVASNDLWAICCPLQTEAKRVCNRGSLLVDMSCGEGNAVGECPTGYLCYPEYNLCCVHTSEPEAEECDYVCEEVYEAVCGSDGQLYANQCILEGEARCRGDPALQVAHPSQCSQGIPTPGPTPPRRTPGIGRG